MSFGKINWGVWLVPGWVCVGQAIDSLTWVCGQCREAAAVEQSAVSMAVSPDARYVVTVNAGYGTFGQYMQSLAGGYADGKVRTSEADTLGRASRPLSGGVQRDRCIVRKHGVGD
jgi:hypothetical protein